MSEETDAMTEILTKITDLHGDVKAMLNVAAGELSAEGKALFNKAISAIDAFDAEIGDADGSDETPAPVTSDASGATVTGTPGTL